MVKNIFFWDRKIIAQRFKDFLLSKLVIYIAAYISSYVAVSYTAGKKLVEPSRSKM